MKKLMINNFNLKLNWRKLLFITIIILSISFLYGKVYKSFHGFPSESVAYSALTSKLRVANCLDSVVHEKSISEAINAPYLPVVGADEIAIKLINQSNKALYFNERIYFLDSIGKEDSIYLALGFLRNTNKLSSSGLRDAVDRVNNFYDNCNKYSKSDYGVTELYWAGKGTSILHHWAYLYEGSLIDGARKAQYGNAIPIAASFISRNLSGLNFSVDRFVKVSLLIFYACCISYCLLFYLAFKRYSDFYLIGSFLLIKIYLFLSLGVFVLMLAPGYHWFREMVCLIVFFSYINLFRKCLLQNLVSMLFILLSYFIDPAFSAISFIAIIFSEIAWNFHRIRELKWVMLFSIIAFSIGIYFQKNNIINLYGSLSEVYAIHGGENKYNIGAYLIIFISIISVIYNKIIKFNKYYMFFSFFSLFSSLYYFTNPDFFHFIKYCEYSIPMFMVSTVLIFKTFSSSLKYKLFYIINRFNIFTLISSMAPLFYAIAIIFIVIFFASKINKIPADWMLRSTESTGESFYNTKSFIINDRLINANFSNKLSNHLKNFPNDVKYDYIISRNDKYLLFLYDKKNNLGNIDLLASINDKVVEIYLKNIKYNKSTVILDDDNFNIDSLSEFKSENPVIGNATSVAYLQLKKQFYLLRLSNLIKTECLLTKTEGNWAIYVCD